MSERDDKTRVCIEHELLRELVSVEDSILDLMNKEISHLEFHAMKYKEREYYEQLVQLKRSANIFKLYLDVAKKHNLT